MLTNLYEFLFFEVAVASEANSQYNVDLEGHGSLRNLYENCDLLRLRFRAIFVRILLFEVALNFRNVHRGCHVIYRGCCDILRGYSDLKKQKFVQIRPHGIAQFLYKGEQLSQIWAPDEWIVLAFFKIEFWNFQNKLSSWGGLNGAVKCNVFNWEDFAKCTKLGKMKVPLCIFFCFLS